MKISESHISMLAVISIFTGMIAPLCIIWEKPLPLAFTNTTIFSYILLFLLSAFFYVASTRNHRGIRWISWLLSISFIFIFFLAMSGKITDENQSATTGISWWWFFILIWIILIAYNFFGWKKEEHHGFSSLFFDRIIGIVWAFTLGCFSLMMITLSVLHFQKNENISILSKFYWSWAIQSLSGVNISPVYEK